MTPANSLVWRDRTFESSTIWKLCQIDASSPWVTAGTCRVNREGCFESNHHVHLTVHSNVECVLADDCHMEMSDVSEGVLDVAEVFWEDVVLEVKGEVILITSSDDLVTASVQGMEASEMPWRFNPPDDVTCIGLRIGTMPLFNVLGPSGDNLWTCTPSGDDCTLTGRFKSFGGGGSPDSCEMCPPGSSTSPGAAACTECTAESLNDHETFECGPSQPGFFSSATGQSLCQESATGRHLSIEGRTACDGCGEGSFLVAKDVGCEWFSPGTFTDNALLAACLPCDAGRSWSNNVSQVQRSPGASGNTPRPLDDHEECRKRRIVAGNIWFAQRERLRLRSRCMGRLPRSVSGVRGRDRALQGYFTSVDNAGFVWRCHGADWARCSGGRPGTCAQGRLNTSIAREECEPFTRTTCDGQCEALCVTLHGGPPGCLDAALDTNHASFHHITFGSPVPVGCFVVSLSPAAY